MDIICYKRLYQYTVLTLPTRIVSEEELIKLCHPTQIYTSNGNVIAFKEAGKLELEQWETQKLD